MLLFVTFASLLCSAAARPSSLGYLENRFNAENESEEVRSTAIKRLLEVFGMDDPPVVHGHKQPPQYMLDLYNTVADVDGVTKDPYILEGNTVRSFFDKRKRKVTVLFQTESVSNPVGFIAVHSEQVEFSFNLSTVSRTEKILTAELHLFKLRPQATLTFNRHHFCQVWTRSHAHSMIKMHVSFS